MCQWRPTTTVGATPFEVVRRWRWLVVVALFVVWGADCTAQRAQKLPQDYFISPLEGAIGLSATFAEFRTNHFHAGLDMRTGGAEGKAVRAVADGYVARVSISPWGGGKILYIKHPNGYVSVYMHLRSYAGAIGKAVANEQRAQQRYAISKTFAAGQLPVKQGQVVAYSGNSGSSGGPHLHFEIRSGGDADFHTHAQTINPLLFGLPYRDSMKPTIRGLRIYPLGGKPVEVGKAETVSVSSPFYLGIYATDAAEGSTPRNGIDQVEVFLDGTLVFRYTTEAIPLDSSRMANALIDYRHYVSTRQAYLLTRALAGAEGPWVPVRLGDGVFRLAPGSTHSIGVRVTDIMNNTDERTLQVRVAPNATTTVHTNEVETNTKGDLVSVAYNQPLHLQRYQFGVELPAHTLYADDRLLLETTPQATSLSAQVSLHPTLNDIPPHKAYLLKLKQEKPTRAKANQVVVVRIDGKRLTAYATTHAEGWHSAKVRDFGCFALALDTLPPRVAPVNFNPAKPLRVSTLKVRLADDLAGIDTYTCHLNGQWILAEYDGKTATLAIDGSGRLKKGHNKLTVVATDACGNRTHKEWTLTR